MGKPVNGVTSKPVIGGTLDKYHAEWYLFITGFQCVTINHYRTANSFFDKKREIFKFILLSSYYEKLQCNICEAPCPFIIGIAKSTKETTILNFPSEEANTQILF